MNQQSLTLTPTRRQVNTNYASFTPDLTPLERSPLRSAANLESFLTSQTCPPPAYTPVEQPLVGFRQIAFFIAFVICGVVSDSIFAITQSIKCTWVLLFELPKLWINTICILVPLWFTAFGVLPLIIKACACKIALQAADRVFLCTDKLFQLWTSLRASPVFRLLASVCSGVVPSSVAPSAQSSRIRFPRASTKSSLSTNQNKASKSTRKVSWAAIPSPDRSSLD